MIPESPQALAVAALDGKAFQIYRSRFACSTHDLIVLDDRLLYTFRHPAGERSRLDSIEFHPRVANLIYWPGTDNLRLDIGRANHYWRGQGLPEWFDLPTKNAIEAVATELYLLQMKFVAEISWLINSETILKRMEK